VRLFAVERIRSLTRTDHPYQMPLGFDVEALPVIEWVKIAKKRCSYEFHPP
jgi:hypothetical protein